MRQQGAPQAERAWLAGARAGEILVWRADRRTALRQRQPRNLSNPFCDPEQFSLRSARSPWVDVAAGARRPIANDVKPESCQTTTWKRLVRGGDFYPIRRVASPPATSRSDDGRKSSPFRIARNSSIRYMRPAMSAVLNQRKSVVRRYPIAVSRGYRTIRRVQIITPNNLHRNNSEPRMSAMGHSRPRRPVTPVGPCPLRSVSDQIDAQQRNDAMAE